MPAGLAPLHGAGELNRATVEQQLLGQRRLAGIRVRDDGKRAPFVDLFGNARHRMRAEATTKGAQFSGSIRFNLWVSGPLTAPRHPRVRRVPGSRPDGTRPAEILSCDTALSRFHWTVELRGIFP